MGSLARVDCGALADKVDKKPALWSGGDRPFDVRRRLAVSHRGGDAGMLFTGSPRDTS